MDPSKILLIEDDRDLCALLEAAFRGQGSEVTTCHSAEAARAHVERTPFHAILTDVHLDGMSGIDFCKWITDHRPETPVVIMTAHATLDAAVSALRAGSIDFLQKPLSVEGTVMRLARVIEANQLKVRVRHLEQALEETRVFDGIIGASTAMKRVFELLERVGHSPASVLVTGETGTGKELVARALHNRADQPDAPFVAVNCSAIPEGVFESELFGHARGAFTDARSDRVGLLARAHGGTLFLDEIGDMPMSMQPKLLRALEEREIRPVGSNKTIPVEVRVVAATHADIESQVSEGRFREDLFFRINVIHVQLPPLRSRGHDILLLAQYFLERLARMTLKDIRAIQPQVAERLLAYNWPGNVRELRNAIEHSVTLARTDSLTLDDLPARVRDYKSSHVVVASDDPEELLPIHVVEQRYILRVLEAVNGNKSQAARILGLDRKTLYRKLERYEAVGAS